MRELLFRGFHPFDGPDTIVVEGEKVTGKWIYGSHILIDGAHYIMPSRMHLHDITDVLPSTVGQYSGLDDSDGRKVFEGDILKFKDEPNDYEWTGCIEFGNPNCEYTWGFQIVHLSGPKPNIDTLCWFDMEEGGAYSEVIGTVFDEDVVD